MSACADYLFNSQSTKTKNKKQIENFETRHKNPQRKKLSIIKQCQKTEIMSRDRKTMSRDKKKSNVSRQKMSREKKAMSVDKKQCQETKKKQCQ